MDPTTETVTTPATETEPEPTSQAQAPETGESAEARIARMEAALKKANSEAAKYRKAVEAVEQAEREKANAALSEMDKLKAHLAETERKAAALERQHLQQQAAEAAKLPLSLASRLQGETLEEMEADAKELAKLLSSKPAPPPVASTNPGSNGNSGETDAQRRKRLFG
jgi:hypothetical protein